MDQTWQLQDAKNSFSEVINRAVSEGPQLITRRGDKTAVILSYEEYEKLCKVQGRLSQFFRESPLKEVNLEHGPEAESRNLDR